MRLFTDKHENKWASLTDKIAYMHNATPRLFQIGGKKVLVSPFQLFLRRPPPLYMLIQTLSPTRLLKKLF